MSKAIVPLVMMFLMSCAGTKDVVPDRSSQLLHAEIHGHSINRELRELLVTVQSSAETELHDVGLEVIVSDQLDREIHGNAITLRSDKVENEKRHYRYLISSITPGQVLGVSFPFRREQLPAFKQGGVRIVIRSPILARGATEIALPPSGVD